MKHVTDILALSFDDERLSAVRVDSTGAVNRLTAPLSVDPLADDSQLAAQELRERLQPLGRPAHTVIVCLPLSRAMVTTVTLPELPEDAVQGFLLLQAEREFLLPPADLALGISRYATADGKRGALLAALPTRVYGNLQRTLRLVGIKRLLVTLVAVPQPGSTPLAGPGAFLLLGPGTADFGVTAGGGLVLLRRLATNPPEATRNVFDVQALLSEVRMTLGQLPAEVRRNLHTIEIHGPATLAGTLAGKPVAGLPSGCWQLPAVAAPEVAGTPRDVLTERCEQAARCVLAGQPLTLALAPVLAAQATGFFRHWTRRQLVTAAVGPLLLFLIVAILVIVQHVQVATLRTRWQAMEPRTITVRGLIAEAKSRKPWMNDQPETLVLLRALTDAFPKRGTVWATRLEIRDRRDVAVAGKAATREAWLQMLDTLRRMPGVTNLRVADARDTGDGRTPLTFALGFRWQPVLGGQPDTAKAGKQEQATKK